MLKKLKDKQKEARLLVESAEAMLSNAARDYHQSTGLTTREIGELYGHSHVKICRAQTNKLKYHTLNRYVDSIILKENEKNSCTVNK